MKFSECVAAIPTHNDLKRTASAHVVDYTRLNSDELQSSILKTGKQYTHPDAIMGSLHEALWQDAKALRAQQVIEKDLEVEHFFEAATGFLFENRLNHVPLKQAGTEHSDGLLAFRDTYIMWDNKSKETAVDLNDHIKQFDRYMEKADKPVPVFMVIAPDFTPNSESVALAYTAEHIGRNICLITAAELKELAELWASDDNKRNSEPFPLGMFARAGRFSLDVVRASFG